MNFSCHYHYVILLVIATVCYVILCDRVIPHALMSLAYFNFNPPSEETILKSLLNDPV